ncbi:hypothetical protein F5888DRAFT_1848211 [Russula emetica]|nr:hypothetical protein F5888DRAFT_1848211 [Russula emetica]
MSNNFSQNYAPPFVGGVFNVAGGFIGRSLIDSLRESFTSSSQEQRGDYFMDQSRVLLQNHLQLIEQFDQINIHRNYEMLRKVKEGLDSHDGSKFQKFLKSRKYRRVSRKTYKIVKKASERGIDNHLMNQIVEATRPPPPPPGSGAGSGPETSSPPPPPGSGSGSGPETSSPPTAPGSGSGSGPETSNLTCSLFWQAGSLFQGTVRSNPFSDSHAMLSEVSVNNLDRVEMSTYQEETTDEAAVVLDLVAEDESVQHVVATFSTQAFTGDRTDAEAPEAPAALSLHREDGSSPRFIAVSLPDVSLADQRADGQGENIHLISAQRAQHSDIDLELTSRLA